MAKEPTKMPTDKKILSFFLIAFPTIIIILLSIIGGNSLIWVDICLAIYQFILLKQFLDNYYEVLG